MSVDDTDTIVWQKRLTWSALMPFIAQIPPWSSGWRPVEAHTTGHGASAHMGLS